jgi:hypothetical protein
LIGIQDWARQAITDVGKQIVGYAELVEGRSHDELLALKTAAADTKRDIEIQLVQRKADLAQDSNRCFALGVDGKKEWFRLQAEHLEWRGAALAAKGHMESLLSHLKLKIQATRDTGFDTIAKALLIEAQQIVAARHKGWHQRVSGLIGPRIVREGR